MRTGRTGDPRCASAQDDLGEAGHGSVSFIRRTSSTTCERRRPWHPAGGVAVGATRNPGSRAGGGAGNPDAGFADAAQDFEAEYEMPFPGAHGVRRRSRHRRPVEWSDDHLLERHEAYGMRRGVATFLGMPPDQVRVIWMQGPQGFGRTAAEDAACEAAWIAREIGRPVRVQWMRDEETAWDTKSPAFLVKMRGALDARRAAGGIRLQGAFVRLQPPRLQRAGYRADRAAHGLAAGTAGRRQRIGAVGHVRDSESPDGGRGRRTADRWETPLRTGNLRDPNGPQATFAAESFIDEAAAAAKADPLEFRMQLIKPGPATTPASGARARWRC